MRIAQLYPFPPPLRDNVPNLPGGLAVGGGETYPLTLSIKLAKKGHKVAFFTGRLSGAEIDKVKLDQNLEVFYLPLFAQDSVQKAFSFRLCSLLFSGGFDVIHCHQLPTLFSFVAGVVARLKGIPCINTHLGFLPKFSKKTYLLAKINARLVHKLIVPTIYSASFYKDVVSSDKLLVLPYGIDTTYFTAQKTDHDLAAKYKKDGKKVILYVGRLIPSKGIDTLIKSLPVLLRKDLDIRLLIIGKGPFQSYLEEEASKLKIAERVVFTGFVPTEKLPYYYTLADVFVLPSVYTDCFSNYNPEPEAFGLVLAEAMACKVPTVASRVGGIPYWIKDGLTGLLFSPGNERELAEKIYQLLTNTELNEDIKRNAIAELYKKYSIDVVVSRLEEIYSQ